MAKLEWNEARELMLGPWRLARLDRRRQYFIEGEARWSPVYDSVADCKQDCEAEVRRLLKAAGVECE